MRLERLRERNDRLALAVNGLKRRLGLHPDPIWPAGSVVRPASIWAFRGQDTPADTLESVLWSARGGDVDRLAELIGFEAGAGKAAAALFAGLPVATQAQYGSPKKLVATFIAAQIPADYTAMAPLREVDPTRATSLVTLRLEDAAGAQEDLRFKLQLQGNAWKLDVPEPVIRRYTAAGNYPSPVAN